MMHLPILILAILTRFALAALPPPEVTPIDNPALRILQPNSPSSTLTPRQMRPDEVMQHAGPVDLWFGSGPTHYDVVQRKVADCWLAAASIAVVLASPDWMSHLFYNADNTPLSGSTAPMVADTQVLLWNPHTRTHHYFKATTFNQSRTEDRNTTRWWNSAIMQSMLQLGATSPTPIEGVFRNGSFNAEGGDTGAALTALTGYESHSSDLAVYALRGGVNALYEDFQMAWKYHTPIVFTTIESPNKENGNWFPGSVLKGGHAYAVMWTHEYTNGTKSVILRNPWGVSLEAGISDISKVLRRVVHLKDFRELNWTKALEGQEGQQTKARRDTGSDLTTSSRSRRRIVSDSWSLRKENGEEGLDKDGSDSVVRL